MRSGRSAFHALRRGGDRPARRSALAAALASVLVVLSLSVAGCKIEMALDTVVEADGSGSVGVRLAADKEIQDLIAQQGGGEGDLFGEFENNVPEGWESETGEDPDGTKWVSAKRTFSDPSEIEELLSEGGERGPAESVGAQDFSLTRESGLLSTKTVFNATFDMSGALAGTGEDLPPGVGADALASIFEVQNRLTLPGSIKEHNADEVEGNTLIWRPSLSGTSTMTATSVAYKWPVILGIAAVVVLVAAAIVAAVVMAARRRGGSAPPPAAAWETAGAAGPAGGPPAAAKAPEPVEVPPAEPAPPPEAAGGPSGGDGSEED